MNQRRTLGQALSRYRIGYHTPAVFIRVNDRSRNEAVVVMEGIICLLGVPRHGP
jgi:hypothetical protein